jgi:hypothetical protein
VKQRRSFPILIIHWLRRKAVDFTERPIRSE